ncbi:vacuolar protein sorting/targeting protein 10 [Coprinopsis marcescibilis]|uniref:Vacuolar protein sorting/targeting protein 10 n=1 Tax=Coprinopsis marcescibilis TaxID=230819 RepID=A0A5C3KWB9_COPMA|nr:vacuolar protein sorting/targeting protein 10 [Coprinopsis marcescibilis]
MFAARCGRLLTCFWLLATIWTTSRAQKPEHSVSSFKNLPMRLFFFDDTLSVIYHDAMDGNLYVSSDEGKSWNLADGIPKNSISMVFEHPFDKRYAFAFTEGTEHYRTEDKGKTWRPFGTPVPPARMTRPLAFHSDPKKSNHILFQGTKCTGKGWSMVCTGVTYYTKESFQESDGPKLLLDDTTRCQFAHSSKDFKHEAHEDLIYCAGYDEKPDKGSYSLKSSRIFSSTDFFNQEKKVEDLGIGKDARGVIAFAIVSKYAVVALKDLSRTNGEMQLYVTTDTKTWAKAHFPHASNARLRENAYTVLESTTHSLGVDVVLQEGSIGTLFLSNSDGTYFVESLKDTNRNEHGFVDYEKIYGVEGVGLANVVTNPLDVEGQKNHKRLRSVVTFDDGRVWSSLRAPVKDDEGNRVNCDPSDMDKCALHLHSVTTPHNYGRVFSSPAPGLVMGVGTVGEYLGAYDDSDTFLSTDAGMSWKMVAKGAHKYEFGDQGSILVIADDEEFTTSVKYSLDLGKTWETYDFGIKIRTRAMVTLPDATSQKFLLLGQVHRDWKVDGPVVLIYLDFAKTRKRKCEKDDFEKWYARASEKRPCIMGHKQWYMRRKVDSDCYVGEKFHDPEGREDDCQCGDDDFECDYNFVRDGGKCQPIGLEPIPAGVCKDPNSEYEGSSGFRKIPGNTCKDGKKLDEKVKKPCSQAKPEEGNVVQQKFNFKSPVVQFSYFPDSATILVRLQDDSMWQSSNEGYTWTQILPDARVLAFYHHKFSNERAYLITDTKQVHYTTDTGRSWHRFEAPNKPNVLGVRVLRFSPSNTDHIIWTGVVDCENINHPNCHIETHWSHDNGRSWSLVDKYVRNCAFAQDRKLKADPSEIICESYRDKKGSQKDIQSPLELVSGTNYFKRKKKIFDNVVGFAKFSQFLVVAESFPEAGTLDLQVSLDGEHFASGKFPPNMSPDTHAYTILESTTNALFVHMTMTPLPPAPQWGNLLKSNSNGTYFGLSIENVNRNRRGYVDFEKIIGLDGIALINVVANTDQPGMKEKKLRTMITHNDGSTWKTLTPPRRDVFGKEYACNSVKCSLHLHGYTERRDPRATFSSPATVGVIMGVGNVGESLAEYDDSDTFISRDGGFTWEEVHKDAHMWEYGDSGSIIIIVNDEEPTDRLLFTTDEGLTWRDYKFSDEKIRVISVTNVPSDTSRRFLLFGAHKRGTVAFHIDFSALTYRQCELKVEDPANDDFELWSPSEDRLEQCLFGRQTLYHRRIRDAQCFVGDLPKVEKKVQKNCSCSKVDFECEFNHIKNEKDECVLVLGTTSLPSDEKCENGEEYWYERTAYRRIPYSSCEGGDRLDRGKAHRCPGFGSRSGWFWLFVLLLPCAFTGLVGYYYYRKSGHARGTIRLPGGDNRAPNLGSASGMLDTLASVPWFLVGVAGIAAEWVSSQIQSASWSPWKARGGYRHIPIDEDAQILRFEDEE